jgi:S1-C subfamily serine protease
LTVGLCVILSTSSGEAGAQEPRTDHPESPARQVEESPAKIGTIPSVAQSNKRLQDVPLESDNLTFRPTVLIRRGTSQGSGTIIASLDGETLILTASHVVRGTGPIQVELHRYNLGIERVSNTSGNWPRQVTAESVASDASADLAILRIRNMVALPYVARLATGDDEPATNAALTSVGIDLGSKLSSWKTRLVEVLWFELNDSGNDRPFLVTAKIPEHGRSGGGLFDKDGQLVGVCVGHAELVKGRRMGVFSSIESARRLLDDHELTSVIDRSEARRARLARNPISPGRHLGRSPRSAVTPTEAKGATALPKR